jgi:hypothetical protein
MTIALPLINQFFVFISSTKKSTVAYASLHLISSTPERMPHTEGDFVAGVEAADKEGQLISS